MTSVRAQITLAASFAIISAVGASAIMLAPANVHAPSPQVRSSVFVIVMACVHAAGYILYSRQRWKGDAELVSQLDNFELSSSYAAALRSGVWFEIGLGILTALLLDGGQTFRLFGVALLAHWIGMLVIVWRRPVLPTKLDLAFIRIGILPLLVATAFVAPTVWKLIGESTLSGIQRVLGH